MTLKNVLLILFAIFLVSIILFILWEKKGVKNSSPLKIQIIDDSFTLFFFFMTLTILAISIVSLREVENRENFLYLFSTLLSALAISRSIIGPVQSFYDQSRHIKHSNTNKKYIHLVRGPANSYDSFASYGVTGVLLFVYFMLGFVLDVPTYMTMESLPVDVFLFFLFSITVIVIGYLTRLNHDTYRYFSNLNPILIFCSFWFLGKNMNNLIKLNLATFFVFIGIMAVAIAVYGLFQSHYFDNNPYLYKKEKGTISKIILTINDSIIGIEVFIIAVYVITLVLTLASGVLNN